MKIIIQEIPPSLNKYAEWLKEKGGMTNAADICSGKKDRKREDGKRGMKNERKL